MSEDGIVGVGPDLRVFLADPSARSPRLPRRVTSRSMRLIIAALDAAALVVVAMITHMAFPATGYGHATIFGFGVLAATLSAAMRSAIRTTPASMSPTKRTACRAVTANSAAILAVIAERAGVTAADIARTSGMKRTVVASTVSRLKRTGELVAEGRGVRLPG